MVADVKVSCNQPDIVAFLGQLCILFLQLFCPVDVSVVEKGTTGQRILWGIFNENLCTQTLHQPVRLHPLRIHFDSFVINIL